MQHNNFSKSGNVRTDVNRRIQGIETRQIQTMTRTPLVVSSQSLPNVIQSGTSGVITFAPTGQKCATLIACSGGGNGGTRQSITPPAAPSGFESFYWPGAGGAAGGLFQALLDIDNLGITSIDTAISSGTVTITIGISSMPVGFTSPVTITIPPGGSASGVTPGVPPAGFTVTDANGSNMQKCPFPFTYQIGQPGQNAGITGINFQVASTYGASYAAVPGMALSSATPPLTLTPGPGASGYALPDAWEGYGSLLPGAGGPGDTTGSTPSGGVAWATLFTD